MNAYYFIVIKHGGSDIESGPLKTEPTTEDIQSFFERQIEHIHFPTMSIVEKGHAEVVKRYYWSQGSK